MRRAASPRLLPLFLLAFIRGAGSIDCFRDNFLRKDQDTMPARGAADGHADGARPPLLLELLELMELPSELEPLVLPSRLQCRRAAVQPHTLERLQPRRTVRHCGDARRWPEAHLLA